MAPRRLRRASLNELAVPERGFRFWLISKTPTVLIDYLTEILLTVVAALAGLGYFTGFSSQNSLIQLIPQTVAVGYSAMLLVGAATILAGFATRKYGTYVSAGLKLLATACLVYAISIATTLGFERALISILMSLALSGIAAWRSFLLYSTFLLFQKEVTRGTDHEAADPRGD